MSAAAVIFARELREKSRLFLICAALALVPFLATLLPSARAHRGDVIAIVGGALALCIGTGVALAMGTSVIARDLAERRLSFYFARPVRPAELWIGKAAASLAVAFFCFGVIAIPAMIFAGPAWERRWLGEVQPILAGALGIAVLFFVSHAFATVFRSRSPLVALDALFAIVSVFALLRIVWPVFLGLALKVGAVLMFAIPAALLILLAVAPVWQLEHGRTDIRRSHAAFSRFFWPGVGVVLLVAGGYVWWLVSAAPGDLTEIVSVEQPPRGSSVLVTGMSKGRFDYQSSFLIDRATGRYERMVTPPWWGIESSQDGRVIAWLQPAGMYTTRQLELYTNGRPTGILINPGAQFVLSDDGSRVAADSGRTVSVYETASARLLGSATGFDSRSQASLLFVTNDVLRVIETNPLRISELDLRTKKLTRTSEIAADTPAGRAISVSRNATRMFVRGPNLIVDGRTGAVLGAIGSERYSSASMLSDGSVAAISRAGQGPRLQLFGRDGRLRHEVPLMPARSHWITGEVEGGKVILAAHGGTMYVVDVATGKIARKLDGVSGPFPRFSADPRLIRFGAGQELVGRRDGRLVAWSASGGAAPRALLR
jgi:hypothetical protein